MIRSVFSFNKILMIVPFIIISYLTVSKFSMESSSLNNHVVLNELKVEDIKLEESVNTPVKLYTNTSTDKILIRTTVEKNIESPPEEEKALVKYENIPFTLLNDINHSEKHNFTIDNNSTYFKMSHEIIALSNIGEEVTLLDNSGNQYTYTINEIRNRIDSNFTNIIGSTKINNIEYKFTAQTIDDHIYGLFETPNDSFNFKIVGNTGLLRLEVDFNFNFD